jgi:hypothetical protein
MEKRLNKLRTTFGLALAGLEEYIISKRNATQLLFRLKE